ncbi:MAG: 2-amino-4-hydroxy-6-hydroxymethyldihydropteridine pyrophosphokinase [Candidatus Tokpelaia hoelldobleri]|uniref:2-amino-4-hydroxy-6-hydroxymethyldihydropteridine pyrophosphokinase n=1 Tax=Candidatus Tokpelaia hoelldobleri TaxID=1902579 RepID=A0A1U9JUQ4_9HYPH|nr:MAG: 2-amino-4-hydroxy-6-hydroxymethyldihydropteridine pyrophosphokinase [Candidatus Tokpelaia hoelldoblerii]
MIHTKAPGKWANAWIGLGGNIGNVAQNMVQALRILAQHEQVRVIAISSLYQTPPWGKTDQPAFLNACAQLQTQLPADDLLQLCLDIEEKMQRRRTEKWGPRTLDIDILLYEGVICSVPGRLVLPHPHMDKRAFVLVPLAEINPALDIAGRSVLERAKELDDGTIQKYSEFSFEIPDT